MAEQIINFSAALEWYNTSGTDGELVAKLGTYKEPWTIRPDHSFRGHISAPDQPGVKATHMRNNLLGTLGPIPADWRPKIDASVERVGGAQDGPAPFLDPFARSRRAGRQGV